MEQIGENVTICYVDPSFDAMRRRNELLINFIECQCKRCKDPTEFGTMYNTVKCIKKDCDGYMLPPTFIVDNCNDNVPDFICDKCNARVSQTTVLDMIAQDEKEWAMLESVTCCDVSKYKKILEKQRKILHEGHGDIVNVKISIVRCLANSLQEVSNELLIEYMKYCEEVTENLKLLRHSETMKRGICLLQLFRSLCEYSNRNSHNKSSIQNQKFQEDSMKIIFECNDLLFNEPSTYCGPDAELLNELKQTVSQIIADNTLSYFLIPNITYRLRM